MKKEVKKLSLYKKTISNLTQKESAQVKGGGILSLIGKSCPKRDCFRDPISLQTNCIPGCGE